MIAYLEGRILAQGETSCVLLTAGGVGYELRLPSPLLASLPPKGEEAAFYCSTIVREDDISLYGFSSLDERDLFETLISISKLGPKTGLAILSMFTPEDLRRTAAGDDPSVLTAVPGIGKKTAQHVFLELKYKLKSKPGAKLAPSDAGTGVFRDGLAGLRNLGYSEEEAARALEAVLKEEPDLDVAQALRQALKKMAKGD